MCVFTINNLELGSVCTMKLQFDVELAPSRLAKRYKKKATPNKLRCVFKLFDVAVYVFIVMKYAFIYKP